MATRDMRERDYVIIVASVSFLYGIGSVETYSAMTFAMQKGETADQREIIRKLVALQYKRNDAAFARGNFRVRGDNLEIFPSHYEDTAWRISFFGDEIEEITEFDQLTGRKIATLEYEIGRASCRERVCQYVEISVVAVSITKKETTNTTNPRSN